MNYLALVTMMTIAQSPPSAPPPASPSPPSAPPSTDNGLPVWAIVVICVGSGLALLCILGCISYKCIRRRSHPSRIASNVQLPSHIPASRELPSRTHDDLDIPIYARRAAMRAANVPKKTAKITPSDPVRNMNIPVSRV